MLPQNTIPRGIAFGRANMGASSESLAASRTGYAAPLAQVDKPRTPLDLNIGHWPREGRSSWPSPASIKGRHF